MADRQTSRVDGASDRLAQTTASIAFPAMVPSSTTTMSVAARKAALLEKFSGGGKSNLSSSSSPASASPAFPKPYAEPTTFSQPDWAKLVAERKERKDSAATVFSLPPKLTPVPTGSTVATAVEQLTPNFGPKTIPSFPSVGSRVRMAVMALNAIDNSSEGPKWKVGAGGEERPPTALSGTRSWSRMSGATRVGEVDTPLPSKSFVEEDEEEEEAPSMVEEPSFMESMESMSLSTDTSYASTNSLPSIVDVDDSFDTHPPDMVSPRTGLAYVILPPWVRRRSVEISPSPTPKVSSSPKKFPLKQDPEPVVSESIPEDEAEDVEEQDHSYTPSASPTPTTRPDPPRTNEPIILRGQGKKRLPSTATQRPTHTRAASSIHIPAHIRMTERVRSTSTLPQSRRNSVQPTQFWNPPERLRRSSSVMSCAIHHEDPLVVKAQNKVPLRKVQTKAPKPMRFSMAF